MQPPAQELQARDIHDGVWTFRHIFRGVEDLALSGKSVFNILDDLQISL
jgi:hypothetical protein